MFVSNLRRLARITPASSILALSAIFFGAILFPLAIAAQTSPKSSSAKNAGTRPTDSDSCGATASGGTLAEPAERRSQNGILMLTLTLRSARDADGHEQFCYFDEQGHRSPTLRLSPGDTLALTLENQITLPAQPKSSVPAITHEHRANATCTAPVMNAFTTNLHFHGMTAPPICHQDDTLQTLVQPTDPPFEYRMQIPKSQAPGLYWYHPHVHGFSEAQILGGASGALIVEGIENFKPKLAGLPERTLVVRDQLMPELSAEQKSDPKTPTKNLSLNFAPIAFPAYRAPTIAMRPGQRELWRVLNASADTYLDLQILINGQRQTIDLVALDGLPINYDQSNSQEAILTQTHVAITPAGRAEFIVTAPPAGSTAVLVTNAVPRGPVDEYSTRLPLGAISAARIASGQDDNDPTRPLANISASSTAPALRSYIPSSTNHIAEPPLPSLAGVRPIRTRKLFFSETLIDPKDPASPTIFFITEEGQTPAVFDPAKSTPDIVVHQGDVEDWIIENRSQEPHAFHIHQTHFLVVGLRGGSYEEPTLRDTINVPAWEGKGSAFPNVKLRMDFRDPNIVGTFPYHCHILQHVDAGMMGTIRVDPPLPK